MQEKKIVSAQELSVLQNSADELLTLLSCQPFDTDSYHSDLCLVVISKRIKDTRSAFTLALLEKRLL